MEAYGFGKPNASTWPTCLQGGWELDETAQEAAQREAMEEAGVLGVVEVRQFGHVSEGAFS